MPEISVRTNIVPEHILTAVRAAHPNPTIGGTPGSYWLACSCGLYITAKPSIRSCRRSFNQHRINEYARAQAEARAANA